MSRYHKSHTYVPTVTQEVRTLSRGHSSQLSTLSFLYPFIHYIFSEIFFGRTKDMGLKNKISPQRMWPSRESLHVNKLLQANLIYVLGWCVYPQNRLSWDNRPQLNQDGKPFPRRPSFCKTCWRKKNSLDITREWSQGNPCCFCRRCFLCTAEFSQAPQEVVLYPLCNSSGKRTEAHSDNISVHIGLLKWWVMTCVTKSISSSRPCY